MQAAARSFSLVYAAEKEGTQRTLDLTCQTHQDFELWFCGLQVCPCVLCRACTVLLGLWQLPKREISSPGPAVR